MASTVQCGTCGEHFTQAYCFGCGRPITTGEAFAAQGGRSLPRPLVLAALAAAVLAAGGGAMAGGTAGAVDAPAGSRTVSTLADAPLSR